MSIVTIDRARQHCRSDSDDDALLSAYLAAAERRVAVLANRAIFASRLELDAAILTLAPNMLAARIAYDGALLIADALADKRDRQLGRDVAERALAEAINSATRIINGIVADDAILAAILLCCGHFYRNRDEGDFPMAVESLMFPYRYIGNL